MSYLNNSYFSYVNTLLQIYQNINYLLYIPKASININILFVDNINTSFQYTYIFKTYLQ